MAFTVQDDEGDVAGANAYITVSEFETYHTDRGRDTSTYTQSEKEAAIVRATDYLDGRFSFPGTQRLYTQTTQWPRIEVYNGQGPVFGLPTALKHAVAEYALRALAGELYTDTPMEPGRLVRRKREKVGSLEQDITYATSFEGSTPLPKFPAADRILYAAGLVYTGTMVVRG